MYESLLQSKGGLKELIALFTTCDVDDGVSKFHSLFLENFDVGSTDINQLSRNGQRASVGLNGTWYQIKAEISNQHQQMLK